MQVVIEIPDDEYEIIKACTAPMTWVEHLIKNGTPLPKGHGSLIDIQDVMKKVSLNYNSHQIIDAQSIKDIIRTTKITIPADKEGE